MCGKEIEVISQIISPLPIFAIHNAEAKLRGTVQKSFWVMLMGVIMLVGVAVIMGISGKSVLIWQ